MTTSVKIYVDSNQKAGYKNIGYGCTRLKDIGFTDNKNRSKMSSYSIGEPSQEYIKVYTDESCKLGCKILSGGKGNLSPDYNDNVKSITIKSLDPGINPPQECFSNVSIESNSNSTLDFQNESSNKSKNNNFYLFILLLLIIIAFYVITKK